MRATLIHNADAGDGPSVESFEIAEALRRLGWSVTTPNGADMEEALTRPADVVVVAGGDGTVGRVARRLAGTLLPIAVVPIGTVNNVARALGLGLDPHAAIGVLGRAVARDVDLGVVVTHDGCEMRFIEGFGAGVFASVVAERATENHKRLDRASTLLAEELESYEALPVLPGACAFATTASGHTWTITRARSRATSMCASSRGR